PRRASEPSRSRSWPAVSYRPWNAIRIGKDSRPLFRTPRIRRCSPIVRCGCFHVRFPFRSSRSCPAEWCSVSMARDWIRQWFVVRAPSESRRVGGAAPISSAITSWWKPARGHAGGSFSGWTTGAGFCTGALIKAASGQENPVKYAELWCKTNFSFLEGASHADELASRAAQLGCHALAITDRNSLAGIVRAHQAAKTAGLKLLIGA